MLLELNNGRIAKFLYDEELSGKVYEVDTSKEGNGKLMRKIIDIGGGDMHTVNDWGEPISRVGEPYQAKAHIEEVA